MPYIKKERRGFSIENGGDADTPGELNYFLTLHILSYLLRHGESYTNYNAVIGVLENIKLELYRRKIAPYEDKKMEENGDVF